MSDSDGVSAACGSSAAHDKWRTMESAPRNGTRFRAKGALRRHVRQMPGSILPGWITRDLERVTWFGKASHVPMYGWCHGRDPENIDLWQPTRWRPLSDGLAQDAAEDGSREVNQ